MPTPAELAKEIEKLSANEAIDALRLIASTSKDKIKKLSADEATEALWLIASKSKSDIEPDTTRMIYKEYGDQIRHYSTIRSTLTTFLVTAALTAFAAYFNKPHAFLIVAGLLFLTCAVAACLIFSFRTEKAVIRFKTVWTCLDKEPVNEELLKYDPKMIKVWKRMVKDWMNWLLMAAVILIIAAVCGRNQLENIFHLFALNEAPASKSNQPSVIKK